MSCWEALNAAGAPRARNQRTSLQRPLLLAGTASSLASPQLSASRERAAATRCSPSAAPAQPGPVPSPAASRSHNGECTAVSCRSHAAWARRHCCTGQVPAGGWRCSRRSKSYVQRGVIAVRPCQSPAMLLGSRRAQAPPAAAAAAACGCCQSCHRSRRHSSPVIGHDREQPTAGRHGSAAALPLCLHPAPHDINSVAPPSPSSLPLPASPSGVQLQVHPVGAHRQGLYRHRAVQDAARHAHRRAQWCARGYAPRWGRPAARRWMGRAGLHCAPLPQASLRRCRVQDRLGLAAGPAEEAAAGRASSGCAQPAPIKAR